MTQVCKIQEGVHAPQLMQWDGLAQVFAGTLQMLKHLAQEAGDVLAPTIAHVASGGQLAHASIHKRESRPALAPALKLIVRVPPLLCLPLDAPWLHQLVPLLQCRVEEEIPERRPNVFASPTSLR